MVFCPKEDKEISKNMLTFFFNSFYVKKIEQKKRTVVRFSNLFSCFFIR